MKLKFKKNALPVRWWKAGEMNREKLRTTAQSFAIEKAQFKEARGNKNRAGTGINSCRKWLVSTPVPNPAYKI